MSNIPLGRFAATPPLLSDGQAAPLSIDRNGNLKVVSPGGFFTTSASFMRPQDVTPYSIGDRVSDATASTVLEFLNVARAPGDAVRIERLRLRKTGPSLTGASFRVHLFRVLPTVNVSDNGAFNPGSAGALAVADIAGRIGTIDVTMDAAGVIGAMGVGTPAKGSGITCEAAGSAGHETSLWAVLEALGTYTPAAGETFTAILEAARA